MHSKELRYIGGGPAEVFVWFIDLFYAIVESFCVNKGTSKVSLFPPSLVRSFRSGFRPTPTWDLWLRGNGLLLAAASLVVMVSVVVVLLLGSHLYLVSHNTTTWEFMSRPRISYLKHCGAEQNPFDRGTLANLWGFFCSWGVVVWEQAYFKEPGNIA